MTFPIEATSLDSLRLWNFGWMAFWTEHCAVHWTKTWDPVRLRISLFKWSKLCQNFVKSTEGQNYVKVVLALLCEPSSCLSACDIKSMPGNASLGLHQWTPLIQNISIRQIGKSSFGHVKTPALQPKIAQTILNFFSDSSVHKFRYVRIKIHAFLCIYPCAHIVLSGDVGFPILWT